MEMVIRDQYGELEDAMRDAMRDRGEEEKDKEGRLGMELLRIIEQLQRPFNRSLEFADGEKKSFARVIIKGTEVEYCPELDDCPEFD